MTKKNNDKNVFYIFLSNDWQTHQFCNQLSMQESCKIVVSYSNVVVYDRVSNNANDNFVHYNNLCY